MKKTAKHDLVTRTWIEIDTEAVRHNIAQFKKLAGRRKLMAVVKSNAYGHDLVPFAKLALASGADWLGVDSLVEACDLQDAGIEAPILVLGYTPPENIPAANRRGIRIAISNKEALYATERANSNAPTFIHIKIDSGMHRLGFSPSEIPGLTSQLDGVKDRVVVEGVYTHFAEADEPESTYTEEQFKVFQDAMKQFQSTRFSRCVFHAANTAATVAFPETHLDLVRVGLGMYGLWPSEKLSQWAATHLPEISLKPALSWRAIVSEVKPLEANSGVGYNRSGYVDRKATEALLPIGYWSGYSTALAHKASVLIRGKRAPILGRPSMDITSFDVTGLGVKEGDIATLIGTSPSNPDTNVRISVEEFSGWKGVIPYEGVTTLNPRIQRRFV